MIRSGKAMIVGRDNRTGELIIIVDEHPDDQSKDKEYIMKGKMQEREGEMKVLRDQVNLMQSQTQTMLSIISSSVGTDEGKQEIARRLIEHEVYKSRNHHHREG